MTLEKERVEKIRILVFMDYYLPGFRAGGPIPSVSRIIEMAHEQCDFRVVTRDHDLGEKTPFAGLEPQTLRTVGNAQVMYLRSGLRDWGWVRKETRQWRPEAVYLNSAHSFFGVLFPLALIKLKIMPNVPTVVIAPRGEFGSGALSMKAWKKAFFKPVIRWLIPSDVVWHASSDEEVQQIKSWRDTPNPVSHTFIIAPDPAIEPAPTVSDGPEGKVILTFASRIDRMKGLDRANRIVSQIDNHVELQWNIHGSVSDPKYLKEIKEQLSTMPPNVTYSVTGSFDPNQSQGIFAESTALVLPTLGENFGHVIAEALSVGCPVFVTPNTPWTALIKEGGGQLIMSDEETAAKLTALATMDLPQRIKLREKVHSSYEIWYERNKNSSNPFLSIFGNEL